MKKIAILFLCLMTLLSGCAVSTIAPGEAGVRYGFGGLAAALDGETVDLSGLNAVLEVAENDGTRGARLYVENGGQVYAEFIVTVTGDEVAVVANGQSSGSRVYTVTDPDTAEAVLHGIGDFIMPDFENMTDEEMEAYMAQLEERLGELEVPELTEEEIQASAEQAQAYADLMGKCLTEAEPMDLEGVTYTGMTLHATEADVAELLRIRGLEGAAQSLEAGGLGLDMTGSFRVSEDGQKSYTDLTLNIAMPGQDTYSFLIIADGADEGKTGLDISALEGEQELGTVHLDLLGGGVAEAPWLDVDTSNATDLTGMTGEDLENELIMALGSLGGQALAGLAIAAANAAVD